MSLSEFELVRAYSRIDAERMRGLPISNPCLQVEAVGFRDWGDRRLGILITPWFMNLILIPGELEPGAEPAPETGTTLRFPAGDFDFTPGNCETGMPRFQRLSLYSEMHAFPDHETARKVAEAVLDGLFQPANGKTGHESPGLEAPKLSRRDLLHRLVTGGGTRA